MKRDRNVKIVATLGPASSSYEMIKELHIAGAEASRWRIWRGACGLRGRRVIPIGS